MKIFYTLFAVVVIGLYGLSVVRGWEFSTVKKAVSGPDVRSSSGGNVYYYSHHRGGK